MSEEIKFPSSSGDEGLLPNDEAQEIISSQPGSTAELPLHLRLIKRGGLPLPQFDEQGYSPDGHPWQAYI